MIVYSLCFPSSLKEKMASQPEKDHSCPVCHDIFKDLIVQSCSHSFCKDCLQTWWREKQTQECPFCKRRLSRSDPPRNLALENLCEAFILERELQPSLRSSAVCTEKHKLFHLDHQQPVSLICQDSKTHTDLKVIPINEAAKDHKEDLHNSLKLRSQTSQVIENCDQSRIQ